MRGLLFAGFIALLFVVPAGAQTIDNPSASTPTTLYFHIFDTFNQFPINTQMPDVGFFEVGGTNFPTTNQQVPGQHPLGPYGPYDFNTIYGWATSGPVEYDFIEDGRPRFHPERGIADTIEIDESVQPFVYLYADLKDSAGMDLAPNTIPEMTFRVTIREGNAVGDTAQLDAGKKIMGGEVTYHFFDSQAAGANDPVAGQQGPDGNTVLVPDEDGIYEIPIPLTIDDNRIPKDKAFNVRIDWYQTFGGTFGDDEFAEGWLWLAMDAQHLPRMEFAISNPVYIEFIHPQVAAGTLLIHTGVNSPWGTYDVDVSNMSVEVTGPTQPQVLRQVVTQNQHVHGLHDKAAEITYLWKFRDEAAKNGDYTIRVSVPNMAGTAVATGSAGFTIEGKKAFGIDDQGEVVVPVDDGEGKDSPGLFVLPVLVGIAILRRWGR